MEQMNELVERQEDQIKAPISSENISEESQLGQHSILQQKYSIIIIIGFIIIISIIIGSLSWDTLKKVLLVRLDMQNKCRLSCKILVSGTVTHLSERSLYTNEASNLAMEKLQCKMQKPG